MTLALPSRRLPPQWVRNDLWRRARAVPSLDLQFADRKSLTDAVSGQNLITFTRASSGTYVDSAGALRTAANDEPRFDHNPITGESLGLLVEEQRTNSIRNNTMQGAVAGTPGTLPTNWGLSGSGIGTLTQQVVGIGASNGITYIDIKYSGTSSNTGVRIFTEVAGNTSATSGQTWTASIYATLLAGSTGITSLTNDVIERNAIGSIIQTTTGNAYAAVGASLTRLVTTRTLSDATTTSVQQGITLNWPNATSVDFTLRIGLPQLEQGAFATSVIPTTDTAVTRAASFADLISQAIANNIRTLYVEFRSPATGTRGVASLNDNTANERAAVITSGTDPKLVVVDGGVTQADIDGGTVAAFVRTRVAARIATDSFAVSVNGAVPVVDSSGTPPTVDRLFIGRDQAGNYLNGHIVRFTGWTQGLPDSALQALTQ